MAAQVIEEVDPLTFDEGAADDRQTAVIERTVIASVALSGSLGFVDDAVTGADFADARLGRIFDGFFEMLQAGEPIDVVTVGEHLAGWGVRGYGPEDLFRWSERVVSPAGVGWYASKVHDLAVRRAVRAEGLSLVQSSRGSDPAGEILADAIERLQRVQTRGVRDEVRAATLGSVLAHDDAYDWALDGLLERGDRLILTGAEGGGKTTLLRQVAIMAAAGIHPFVARDIDPVRLLYVDAENTEKQWAREVRSMAEKAAQFGKVDPRETLRLHVTSRMDLTQPQYLGRLHKLIDQHKPDILVVGPLYRLVPHAINSDDEAAPLLTALDTIHDRGIALAIEAHAGHGKIGTQQRDMRPRGSAALLGWPEFGLGITPDRDSRRGGSQLVRWRGHRDRSRVWPEFLSQGGPGDWPWVASARDQVRGAK